MKRAVEKRKMGTNGQIELFTKYIEDDLKSYFASDMLNSATSPNEFHANICNFFTACRFYSTRITEYDEKYEENVEVFKFNPYAIENIKRILVEFYELLILHSDEWAKENNCINSNSLSIELYLDNPNAALCFKGIKSILDLNFDNETKKQLEEYNSNINEFFSRIILSRLRKNIYYTEESEKKHNL